MQESADLYRTFDAERVNRIINDPAVLPWVSLGTGSVDASLIVGNPNNFCVFDDTGGFVFVRKDDGVFDVHTQFLPEGRGRHALIAARAAAAYMFERPECVALQTFCAHVNRAAIYLARKMGFVRFEEDRILDSDGWFYRLTRDQWKQSCQ